MWPGLPPALVAGAGASTSKYLRNTRWKLLPFMASFTVTCQREGTQALLPYRWREDCPHRDMGFVVVIFGKCNPSLMLLVWSCYFLI